MAVHCGAFLGYNLFVVEDPVWIVVTLLGKRELAALLVFKHGFTAYLGWFALPTDVIGRLCFVIGSS